MSFHKRRPEHLKIEIPKDEEHCIVSEEGLAVEKIEKQKESHFCHTDRIK